MGRGSGAGINERSAINGQGLREACRGGFQTRLGRATIAGGVVVLPEEEICAGGFVIWGGKVLALRRWNGVWLPPKGHVDPGESLEEAAAREVFEEAGLTAIIGPKLGETAYTHSEDDRLHRKRVHWFLMQARTSRVKLEAVTFDAHLWLDLDEIGTFTFAHDREFAAKALNHS